MVSSWSGGRTGCESSGQQTAAASTLFIDINQDVFVCHYINTSNRCERRLGCCNDAHIVSSFRGHSDDAAGHPGGEECGEGSLRLIPHRIVDTPSCGLWPHQPCTCASDPYGECPCSTDVHRNPCLLQRSDRGRQRDGCRCFAVLASLTTDHHTADYITVHMSECAL